jgi:hypothetical protein
LVPSRGGRRGANLKSAARAAQQYPQEDHTMGMFSGIMEKLGFDRSRAERAAARMPPTAAQPRPAAGTAAPQGAPATPAQPSATAAPASISEVDVMSKLESLAAASPQKLNWRQSIVDLLKLLGMDSSVNARKKLAAELGCPPEKMGDSAQMNVWLHKTVMQKLAENGGNIPKELLH